MLGKIGWNIGIETIAKTFTITTNQYYTIMLRYVKQKAPTCIENGRKASNVIKLEQESIAA